MKKARFVFGVLTFFLFLPFQTFAEEAELSYSRRLIREGGDWVYVVGPRAPHLYMISRDLYGTESRWRDLARWNDLKEPYRLENGQRLLLKEAPTTSVEQGNFILSEAWEARGEAERARRIRVSLSQDSSIVTKVEAKIVEEGVPSPAPAPTPTPEPAPRRAEVPPPTPPPASVPVPVEEVTAPAESPKQELQPLSPEKASVESSVPLPPPARETKRGHWHFGLKVLATMTDIYEQDRVTNSKQSLRTQVDPGIEVEAEWKFGRRSSLLLGASYESLEIHPPEGLELEHGHLGLSRFLLGLAYDLNSWIKVSVSGASEQMGFFEATVDGGKMERADIPQFILGSRWLLKDASATKIHANFQLMALLPARALGEKLETGFGAGLGLDFSHPLTSGAFGYGIFARASEQNSEAIDKQQTSAGLHFGWSW